MDILHRATLVPSSRSGYRLNLVVPTIDAARTFGGIRTAIEVFEAIGVDGGERRIIAAAGAGASPTAVVGAYVEGGDDPSVPRQVAILGGRDSTLTVRADDVFVATFWTTAHLVSRIRAWQRETFGWAPDAMAYLIQDYEPGFYPFSAHHLLARATYDRPDETIGIFNASTLRDYFRSSGIRFEREHMFEPRILPELRAAMARPAVQRSRTIVVYGRPTTPRNAFSALVDGLRAWRQADPGSSAWTVLSVGEKHPVIDLGDGLTLRAVGKLDLDAYATLLRESAIGVSFMVSPHPSYPPLEMAHLGMLTLTNGYATKDLATWHTNFRSIDDLDADHIARELTDLCRRFDADPEVGAKGRPIRMDFLSDEPQFAFAEQLATELRASTARDAVPTRNATG